MKKIIVSLVAVSFLAVSAGTLLAAEATPGATPGKMMKHKVMHAKVMKKGEKAKGSMTPSATPGAKAKHHARSKKMKPKATPAAK